MEKSGGLMGNWKFAGTKKMLLTVATAGGVFVSSMLAQSAASPGQNTPPAKAPAASVSAGSANKARTETPVTYRPSVPQRAREYYGIVWGVDSFAVKQVESGEIIRFSWRVLDSDRAKLLNDVKVEPYLVDPAKGVKLVVPELPFMGKMRVKNEPQVGKTYWIGFSNPGRVVKPGDRVIVVVGKFYADALVVQ